MKKIYIVLAQYSTYDSEEESIEACFECFKRAMDFMNEKQANSKYLKYIIRTFDIL